jgi:prolyl-tRNA synthetase
MDQPVVVETAERLYEGLCGRGVEAVLDDRDVTAGVKFADADLIGFPIQVVVGKRGLDAGTVDLKVRASGARSRAEIAEAMDGAAALLGEAP